MSDHKSAAKKARRDVEARLRNRGNRSVMKTEVKKFLGVLATGKKADATAALPAILGIMDRAAKKGVIHKNAADRTKSRLTLKVNALA